ncbi:hypothetical protein CLOP_g2728 [Closterium sp. NIES-67]|nr:hypothetical protein CLOP_g2728 [Closterium sp. NIES-67]
MYRARGGDRGRGRGGRSGGGGGRGRGGRTASGGRGRAGGGGAGRKRARNELIDDGEREESFFARAEEAAEDDAELGSEGEGEDARVVESAEAKRLRIARSYLSEVKRAAALAAREKAEEEAEEAEDRDGEGGIDGEGESEEEEDEGEEGDEDDGGEGDEGDEGLREEQDALIAARLKQDALEESGRVIRRIATRYIPSTSATPGQSVGRRHRQSVTGVALSLDDRTGFAVSKDGLIIGWDVESGTSFKFPWPENLNPKSRSDGGGAGGVVGGGGGGGGGAKGKGGKSSRHLLSVSVSDDGRYLAAGGHDRMVHLWDARTRAHVKSFSGHRGAVLSLSFRPGSLDLFSASADRSIKLWSCADVAYMDSLFGHQAEIVALHALRQPQRVVSVARDRTCRLWKVPEETQLVFRAPATSCLDSCAFLSPSAFITGGDDGSLSLWSALKKKPVHVVRAAHGIMPPAAAAGVVGTPGATAATTAAATTAGATTAGATTAGATTVGATTAAATASAAPADAAHGGLPNGISSQEPADAAAAPAAVPFGAAESAPAVSPPAVPGSAVQSWVGAVAVAPGADLAASGAGDGALRLWHCDSSANRLRPVGSLPTVGFINAIAFAHRSDFVIAGIGQEPRLGRWGRNAAARNGVVLHRLQYESE